MSHTPETDQFYTIKKSGEGLFRDKGSKFIGYASRVSQESDVLSSLSAIRDAHPKSRHLCYGYRLGLTADIYRVNDDGEPSGSAGRPIFDVVRSYELHECLIAVVRYFGGTKLGIPGLIQAYKSAAQEAIEDAEIELAYLTERLELNFEPEKIGQVYNYLKHLQVNDIENSFPKLYIKVRKSQVKRIRHDITALYHGLRPAEVGEAFSSDLITIKEVI